MSIDWALNGALVSSPDCHSIGRRLKSPPGQNVDSSYMLHLRLLASSAIMCTLTVNCGWEDERARERNEFPP